ncbi:hypothetical protein [Streptomyces sp. NPDC048436]|uniref:hypothetical protein n=1 Tax=Streptomyces sp. NPDC048436 TaxID=3365550 RepID=UPI00371C4DB5
MNAREGIGALVGGGGGRTQLDLDVIKGMGTGLNNVKKAFEGLEDLGGKYEEDFGNGDLADKFGDFADNWKLSRKRLTDEVDALAQIAKAAAEAYESIDHQLAEAIRDAQDPKPKKKG